MINRDSRGHSYLTVRGEILGDLLSAKHGTATRHVSMADSTGFRRLALMLALQNSAMAARSSWTSSPHSIQSKNLATITRC